MGIAVVPEQDTPAGVAVGKWIVAVGILVGTKKKRTVGVDKAKSTVASGNVKDAVAILMGSPVHQGRSVSVGKAGGILVGAAEVDRNWTRSQTDPRMSNLAA